MDGDAPSVARFRAMGTDVEVLTVGAAPDVGEIAAAAIERLEAKWSRFRPDSELSRLNAAGGAPVVVSRETYELVERAIQAWEVTAGRYDPTVLDALLAAGYDRDFSTLPRDQPTGPGSSAADGPRPSPGCAGIDLDPIVRAVRLPPGVGLDLGGIGKGYCADLVAVELARGVARGVLVNMGGDLRAVGTPPDPGAWVVEVDDPMRTGNTGVLTLGTGAIATSTRLKRAWTRGGVPQHHLIDPRTGRPAASGLASVTVVAGEAWRAEVVAKAAFLAGPDEGAVVVAATGCTGLLVTDDGEVRELPGLAAHRP